MNQTHLGSLWLLFWTGNAATWVAVRALWMSEIYTLILGALSTATIVVALVIALCSKLSMRGVIALACGLLVGQWWLIETGLLRAYWTFSGFAP